MHFRPKSPGAEQYPYNQSKTGYFLSKLAITTILDAILDMKYYFNPKKPLKTVSLGSWEYIE